MFLVLMKLGVTIFNPPAVFGVYWAYVFPMSAMATGAVKMAQYEESRATEAVAWVLVGVSVLTLIAVFLRMSAHHV
jgi:tellurite resistance protein TehA-like permease